MSNNDQGGNQPRGHDPGQDGAHGLVDRERARREAEQAAQRAAHQHLPVYLTTSTTKNTLP